MIPEFTHRADERGILRQIVSPAELLDWLDALGDDYERPIDFSAYDEWNVGLPHAEERMAMLCVSDDERSEEWENGFSPGERP